MAARKVWRGMAVDDSYRGGSSMPGAERRPVATWALLGVNIVVWLAATAAGGTEDPEVLLDFGAMSGPLVANGQYWRLFTAMFLHVGVAHLAFNGFGLLIFGQLVERTYGHARFLTIYILAGLSGSVASYLLNTIFIGAGASGAIFGVLGALAAFFVARRKTFGGMARRNLTGLLVLAAINLSYGWVTPGIDNWAHIGGLAAGFLLGLALAPEYRLAFSRLGLPTGLRDTNSLARRWWIAPASIAVLLAGAWLGGVSPPESADYHMYMAERYFRERSYDAALDEIAEAVRLEPFVGDTYYLRALIFADLGDVAAARAELSKAIRLGDDETRARALALMRSLEEYRS
jgi:rhomboid protease GluP